MPVHGLTTLYLLPCIASPVEQLLGNPVAASCHQPSDRRLCTDCSCCSLVLLQATPFRPCERRTNVPGVFSITTSSCVLVCRWYTAGRHQCVAAPRRSPTTHQTLAPCLPACLPRSQPEDDSVFRTGAVVLSMTGAVALELMVAQGCRPLTPYSYTVTRVQPGAAGGVLVLGLSQKGLDGGGEISPVEALGRDLQGQFSSKAEL